MNKVTRIQENASRERETALDKLNGLIAQAEEEQLYFEQQI